MYFVRDITRFEKIKNTSESQSNGPSERRKKRNISYYKLDIGRSHISCSESILTLALFIETTRPINQYRMVERAAMKIKEEHEYNDHTET